MDAYCRRATGNPEADGGSALPGSGVRDVVLTYGLTHGREFGPRQMEIGEARDHGRDAEKCGRTGDGDGATHTTELPDSTAMRRRGMSVWSFLIALAIVACGSLWIDHHHKVLRRRRARHQAD
jgi:hypothetical protein